MTMTAEEAIARAKTIAAERGWHWLEPARVTVERPFLWFLRGTDKKRLRVRTNYGAIGCTVIVYFDAETGRLEGAGFLPR